MEAWVALAPYIIEVQEADSDKVFRAGRFS